MKRYDHAVIRANIDAVSRLIDWAAKEDTIPCVSSGDSCIRRIDPPYSRPLTPRQYQRMCESCVAYFTLQCARNHLIGVARIAPEGE